MGEPLIAGVLVTPLRRIANPKGEVLHALKRSAPGYAGFGEAYFSLVRQDSVKGWKRHRTATLNIVVPVGAVRFVIHDDRRGSATCGRFFEVVLGGEHYARLTVPPGLWMAFQGRSAGMNLLLDIIDEEHDPDEAESVELPAIPFTW